MFSEKLSARRKRELFTLNLCPVCIYYKCLLSLIVICYFDETLVLRYHVRFESAFLMYSDCLRYVLGILCASSVYYVFSAVTTPCVMHQFLLENGLLTFVQMPEGMLEISIWNVLRPAISSQVFLGFPVYQSKCWDGSRYFQVATTCFSYSPP